MTALLTALVLAADLSVGDVAPPFSVEDTDRKVHKLTEMLKQGPVVLAFFPAAFTPG
jgi:thioredoxin-dependent peroxiredoxin